MCNVISKAAGREDRPHDRISGGRASDRATATFKCDSDSDSNRADTQADLCLRWPHSYIVYYALVWLKCDHRVNCNVET